MADSRHLQAPSCSDRLHCKCKGCDAYWAWVESEVEISDYLDRDYDDEAEHAEGEALEVPRG